ncbi:MAG: universal stress protein [Pseudomonadota bacterium]
MSVSTMFLYGDKSDEAALVYAARLAKLLVQPLRVVASVPDPSNVYAYSMPEFSMGFSTQLSRQIIEEQETVIAESRAAFKRVSEAEALVEDRATFLHRAGYPTQAAAEEALLTDAFVFPRAAARGGHALSSACEHILMDRALPIIVSGSDPRVQGPVIIAWDGSEQVARSVRLHLPVFRHIGEVTIAHKDEGSARSGEASVPAHLQQWLQEKGISVETKALSGHVGHGLLDLAKQHDAAMIVSGAYGHSRAGQYLFGGVTRTLMQADEAPALALCH